MHTVAHIEWAPVGFADYSVLKFGALFLKHTRAQDLDTLHLFE